MWNIDFCNINEISDLMLFINEKWKENHILSISKELFCFQHLDNERVNFIVAKDFNENRIRGILGFIINNKYDKEIKSKDIWGAIWKVDEEFNTSGLGYLMYKFLMKQFQPNFYGALGVSQVAMDFYRILGYNTGFLNQYYVANNELKEFNICKSPIIRNNKNSNIVKYYKKQSIDELSLIYESCPLKTFKYFKNRYENHPLYSYDFYHFEVQDLLKSVMVTRKITVNDSTCIRIVDILGVYNINFNLQSTFQKILAEEKSEYVDCLNYGMPKEFFLNMGFINLDFDSETIIPNYFEPFEQKNVKIEFAFKTDYENINIFKGDSDQDRPNIL